MNIARPNRRARPVRWQHTVVALATASLLSLPATIALSAHQQGGKWSQPYRLSSDAGRASEAYLAADPYGYVHAFWTETLYSDQRRIIQYARYDGAAWTDPNEIYVTGSSINNLSPVVDRQGTLHIAWSEGLTGPAYYTHGPAHSAMTARAWTPPRQINIPARALVLRIDSTGVFHIVYLNQVEQPGVYYIRSDDQGATWSEPAWLDPDILPDHIPDSLSFELDEVDGLHVVWIYGARSQAARPDWVRYARSVNGGLTWSAPFLIDQAVPEANHNLVSASPIMITQGHSVHVIWAAGSLPYRFHRFSTDAGETWSAPRQIFGELHGQAFDSFAVDGAGRIHFFAQLRYPQGIYHAYWDHTRWTAPALVYLIAQEGASIGDRIHAHHTHAVVRAGNQLVLTFADGPADPNRRLFAMQLVLDDVSPIPAVPTPVPTALPVRGPSLVPIPATPVPTPTATMSWLGAANEPARDVPNPDRLLQMALLPTLALLAGAIGIRWAAKLKP